MDTPKGHTKESTFFDFLVVDYCPLDSRPNIENNKNDTYIIIKKSTYYDFKNATRLNNKDQK